jgi:beta-N-acetylhexosaminidase
LLVAYDGMQFYRLFNCAQTASARGELDEAMLRKSETRLEARWLGGEASASTNFARDLD